MRDYQTHVTSKHCPEVHTLNHCNKQNLHTTQLSISTSTKVYVCAQFNTHLIHNTMLRHSYVSVRATPSTHTHTHIHCSNNSSSCWLATMTGRFSWPDRHNMWQRWGYRGSERNQHVLPCNGKRKVVILKMLYRMLLFLISRVQIRQWKINLDRFQNRPQQDADWVDVRTHPSDMHVTMQMGDNVCWKTVL